MLVRTFAQNEPGDDTALDDLIGGGGFIERLQEYWLAAQERLSSVDFVLQLAIILGALIPAALFGPQLKKFIVAKVAPSVPYGVLRRAANAFAHIATPIALYIIWQIAGIALGMAERPNKVVAAGVSLLTAWIVIRLVTLVIRSAFWSRVAFYLAWPIAALDAFGVLDDAVSYLQSVSIPLGKTPDGALTTFSALDALRVIVIFVALFWIASFINRFLKSRISGIEELTPSLQALLIKVLNILLPVAALLLALQIVGFNFATLAIFGGAVGLGIGLGLQRTISNFFAGFTLIADKSIKPGDVVEVGETFGWVTEMNARYVTIRTRDGKSHLVPNDKFIDDGVVNWSHSERNVRLHARFRVSYETKDLRAVKKAAEEVAAAAERVLKSPAPVCNLVEFAESAIVYDLRFWINDPTNGICNVTSQVLLALRDRLSDMGVEMPIAPRDIRIRSLPDGAPPLPQ